MTAFDAGADRDVDAEWAPWYVIPADHKCAHAGAGRHDPRRHDRTALDLQWPEVSEAEHRANVEARRLLEAEA